MMRPIEESNEGCIPSDRPPIEDWIAIVERGGCTFVDKVRSLQKSGAKAVIIGDKHYNGWITMYATGKVVIVVIQLGRVTNTIVGDASDIVIPSVYVAQYQFLSLLQHLDDENNKPVFIRITENELFSW